MPSTDDENSIDGIDKQASEIAQTRKRPLLVIYYPNGYGSMEKEDVSYLYGEFRRRGWSRDKIKPSLDVLLHTFGGDPVPAYRIAQLIHDFAENVVFLVPEHAFSGGTVTCLSGSEIRLGAHAGLSPIDITIGTESRGVQLLNIDYFKDFACDCRKQVEKMLRKEGRANSTTDVDSALLVEMTRQVKALNVGLFFRERMLTGHYARRLLIDYMLRDNSNKDHLSEQIIQRLLFEMPSHNFDMDYHILREMNLPVEEMDEHESDLTKGLVHSLDDLTKAQIICKDV
jgi:hypothetical protein